VRERDIRLRLGAPLGVDGCHRGAVVKRGDALSKLGEGIVNGLLTARVGIAAIEVCRPLPFVNGNPPRLADVMSELTKLGKGRAE